jgi:hypothetical protein
MESASSFGPIGETDGSIPLCSINESVRTDGVEGAVVLTCIHDSQEFENKAWGTDRPTMRIGGDVEGAISAGNPSQWISSLPVGKVLAQEHCGAPLAPGTCASDDAYWHFNPKRRLGSLFLSYLHPASRNSPLSSHKEIDSRHRTAIRLALGESPSADGPSSYNLFVGTDQRVEQRGGIHGGSVPAYNSQLALGLLRPSSFFNSRSR